MKRMVAGFVWLVFVVGSFVFILSAFIAQAVEGSPTPIGFIVLTILGYIVAALPGTTLIRYGRRAMRKEKDATQARINSLQAQCEVK